MQNYIEVASGSKIRESRQILLNNQKTIMSMSSGPQFPTESLVVGMPCLRTDENALYVLHSINPVKWIKLLTYKEDSTVEINGQWEKSTYEDVFEVEDDNTNTFPLTHVPLGKIRLYINGFRYFNSCSYISGSNSVYVDTELLDFSLSNSTVVMEYDY